MTKSWNATLQQEWTMNTAHDQLGWRPHQSKSTSRPSEQSAADALQFHSVDMLGRDALHRSI